MSYIRLVLVCFAFALCGCLVTRSQVRDQEKQEQITTQLQESKAQTTAQLVEVDETMREMNGKVEELEANVKQLKMQNQAIEEERNKERHEYDEKLKIYQDSLSKLELQYQNMVLQIQQLQEQKKAATAVKVPPQKQKGLFEIGEDFYNEKNWKQAIVEFDKYRTKYPKGRRYTNATFFIGRCFEELKMKDQAKVFYSELVDRYPKTAMADKARDRLKKLK